jgi:hypothetical protein
MRKSTIAILVILVAVSSAEADSTRQVTIVNGTHFAIFAVQAKPSGSTAWQPDVLNQKTLGIGQIRGVGMPASASCKMDFLATLDDGHKVLIPDADICHNPALPVTDDRH